VNNKPTIGISFATILLSAFLIAACDDSSTASGTDTKASAVSQPASTRKAVDCDLISAADIERITGVMPDISQPIPQSQFSGCQWLSQDNPKVLVQIMLSPRSIGFYHTFDEYISEMTETYGEDTVKGQKEVKGLGALAVLHTIDKMLAVSVGDMDLYVNAPRNDVSEAELVALTELVLERMR
jgi:hypothetical protein